MTVAVVKGKISPDFAEGIEFILDEKKNIIGAKTIIEPMMSGYNSDTKEQVKETFPIEVEIVSKNLAQSIYDYVKEPKNLVKFKHISPVIIGELTFDYVEVSKTVSGKVIKSREYLPVKIVVKQQDGFKMAGDYFFMLGVVRTAKDFKMMYSDNGGSTTAYNTVVYNTFDPNRKDEKSTDKNIQKGLLDNWIDVKLFGSKAESIDAFIKKGQQVFLQGVMQLGIFTPKDEKGKPKGEAVRKLSWNVFDFEFAQTSGGGKQQKADLGVEDMPADENIDESELIGEEQIPF